MITIETQRPHRIIRDVCEIQMDGGKHTLITENGQSFEVEPGQQMYYKHETVVDRAGVKFKNRRR